MLKAFEEENPNKNFDDIKDQHFEMMKRVRNLLDVGVFKQETREITDILIFIEYYLAMHIKSEETMMRLFDYPEYCSHKITHQEILEVFESCKNLFKQEKNSINFILYLKEEFLNKVFSHFSTEDIVLNDFIKKHCENFEV